MSHHVYRNMQATELVNYSRL